MRIKSLPKHRLSSDTSQLLNVGNSVFKSQLKIWRRIIFMYFISYILYYIKMDYSILVEDIGIEEEVVPKKRGRPRSSQVASETKPIQMHSHSSLPLRTSPPSPTQPVENIEDSESGRTSPQTPVLVNHSDVQGEDTNNSSPADVEEVWQHYMTRADYHVFVAGSHTKLGKSKGRTNNTDDSEEIATIKRIERAVRTLIIYYQI
uniref:Uncharacterized protein n=1 Tax=Heterorhabditis bacteriophora TaxID=37862 RepID=A0A1I7WWP4_HETBA